MRMLTLGRIVRYKFDDQGRDYAAMVTQVFDNDVVCLVVFDTPNGPVELKEGVPPGETGHSWHWPDTQHD